MAQTSMAISQGRAVMTGDKNTATSFTALSEVGPVPGCSALPAQLAGQRQREIEMRYFM